MVHENDVIFRRIREAAAPRLTTQIHHSVCMHALVSHLLCVAYTVDYRKIKKKLKLHTMMYCTTSLTLLFL